MSDRIREVAERANVPEGFVRHGVALGALPAEEAGLGPREVRRARLLHAWARAGLSVETIVELVERRALSLAFLDAPVMATPDSVSIVPLEQLADHGVSPVAFLQALHQALGFAPPELGARAGEDDVTLLDIAELFRGCGVGRRGDPAADGRLRRQLAPDRQGRGRVLRDQHRAAPRGDRPR